MFVLGGALAEYHYVKRPFVENGAPEEIGPVRVNRVTLAVGRLTFAVGTRVTSRPPHRSVRAQFGHTAPTLGV